MNECVKKRQADDVVAKNYVKMHAVQSQAWQMHRRKKAHNARNLLSSREATFSEHDFSTKIGIFRCMRKSTFGNLEALPPSYLVPLAIFFVNVNSLRNICKRHCYLAKVQSGTIWTSVFLSSLAKKVSNSLPQVYVTITISTRRYYET